METLRVRPWRPADREAVSALILGIQRGEYGLDIDLTAQPDLVAVDDFYFHGDGGFWVAQDDGAIVGCIGLRDIGQGDAALRKMFVTASHRGGGRGVAAVLLETLLAHAVARGLRAIYLGTTERFLAAHRFYGKHGFIELPREALPGSFPVMAVDSRFFLRRLGTS